MATGPELTIKQDDLYARAWECEYDKPKFDSDYNNLVRPNSTEITIWSEEAADEMRSTPRTIQENFPGSIPETNRSYDGLDRVIQCSLMRKLLKSNSILRLPNPAAQKMIYVIIQSQIAMTITDVDFVPQPSTERKVLFPEILGTCYGTDMRRAYKFFEAHSSLPQITTEHRRSSITNFGICTHWELDRHHNAVINPPTIYGAFPETFRKIFHNLIPDKTRNTYKSSYYSEDNPCTATRFLLNLPMQKKDGYSNCIQISTKFQMREVNTYIQRNCFWNPPRKTGALRQSRPLLLAPDFSLLFSRAVSNEGRLADRFSTENCFFFATTELTGTRLYLLFPGVDSDRLQQGRPSLSCFSTCAHLLLQRHQRCG